MKVCPVLSNRIGLEKKDSCAQNKLRYLSDSFERTKTVGFKSLKDIQNVIKSEQLLKIALRETGAAEELIQFILKNPYVGNYGSFCQKIKSFPQTEQNVLALNALKAHLNRIGHTDMANAVTERIIPKMQSPAQVVYA